MAIYEGGYTNYGETIGILMLDTAFPRIPGDVGNATTYSFPVRYKRIDKATTSQVVLKGAEGLLDSFIRGAQELEREGVKAITTSCGFLAKFQKKLQKEVSIPVFTSSLIQVPLVYNMLGKRKSVGIMTANSQTLREDHFNGVGWSAKDIPVMVAGMEKVEEFPSIFVHNTKKNIDVDNVADEMIRVGRELIYKNPDIGAIVLECTNMPPFRCALQENLKVPVFDIVTLINYVHSSIVQKKFDGFF